jgi:septum formation protein
VLSDPEILRYLQQEAAFDCAGSFKCEGFGITLVESIETDDPTALIGLPLISLVALLKEQGLPLP